MCLDERITGASLCTTNWSNDEQACRVFSQLIKERKPQQNMFVPGSPSAWQQEDLSNTGAMPLTPLACVSWNDGNEVRLFYLNSSSTIYEFALVTGANEWQLGTIHTLEIAATPGAGLAATVYTVPTTTIQEVRVYYQDDRSIIRELVHRGKPGDTWQPGTTVPIDALLGTELAAVVYPDARGQIRTHLFYQSKDLTVRESIFTGGGWAYGDFVPTLAMGKTPLAATTYVDNDGKRAVQIYWRNNRGEVIYGQSLGNIWGNNKVIKEKIPSGHGLGVIQWKKGFNLRLYFQKYDGPELVEWQSNDGGITWTEVGPF